MELKFAGPCAQGVLDPVIVPRPMSQGRDGLFWLKNLLIWAFLGTSAHESVPPVGYLLATRWLLVGYLRFPVERRDLAKR